MRMEIGPSIARLRREKGVTQEQLAAAVGVSAPAVSKWESGQSYPDITLLAPLARFFAVSVDALLAYRPTLTADQADQLAGECANTFAADGWEAGLSRCVALEREYPGDNRLQVSLAMTVQNCQVFAPEPADRQTLLRQQEALLLAAVRSNDPELQPVACYLLGFLYLQLQEYAKAEETLSTLPTADHDPRQLLPGVYLRTGKLDEAAKLLQENLFNAIIQANNALLGLVNVAARRRDRARADRYAAAQQQLLRLFQLEQRLDGAIASAELLTADVASDQTALLAALERFADSLLRRRMPAGDAFFDRLSLPDSRGELPWDQALRRRLAADLRRRPDYAGLRDDPGFMAILRRLDGDTAER